MFKDILREQQPVVYHTLRNALENDRLAHAYMFSGPSGTPKKETAYLLAQSLVCGQPGFACETCDTCERIIHNEYADMIYLDGTSVSIKKDDILKLQHAFAKTGLEKTGKKIYVLDHAENATPDALNSLLKFLEEPGSDMIAILIVEQLDRVLPTIISHNTMLPSFSAGSTFSTRCCRRLAAYSNASQRSSIAVFAGSRMTLRICSAISIPPGSLVYMTGYPISFSLSYASLLMVVFPLPSFPSNVINNPLFIARHSFN